MIAGKERSLYDEPKISCRIRGAALRHSDDRMRDGAADESGGTAPYCTVSKATTAKSVTETDRDHKLYEEDDVHRKTDRDEPDIIDRAESAMDSAESVLTEMMTDAEEKLDEMHEHDN